MATNIIKRTTWRTNRSWNLQGLGAAVYAWLSERVPGDDGNSSTYRGFELSGTLNPDDPDPKKYKPPPSWLTPEKMMQGAAVWYGAAIQDYLFREGLAPLVRGRCKADTGALDICSCADVSVSAWCKLDTGSGQLRYYFIVDDESMYPLREASTISVTPVSAPLVTVSRVISGSYPVESAWVPSSELPSKYRGWYWRFEGDVDSMAYVHVYA